LPSEASRWRVLDDGGRELGSGDLNRAAAPEAQAVEVPPLGIGWYRIEIWDRERPDLDWTTAAVLRRRGANAAGFAGLRGRSRVLVRRGDHVKQRQFASWRPWRVNWVRDRLRWAACSPHRAHWRTGRRPMTRPPKHSTRQA
jgi:hypothetical protein